MIPILNIVRRESIGTTRCGLTPAARLPQLFGLFTLALEWPIAPLKGTSLSRSFTFKAVFYVWCGFLCSACFLYSPVIIVASLRAC